MRTAFLSLVFLACDATGSSVDSGITIVVVPGGTSGSQSCEPVSRFPRCRPAEERTRELLCDLSTVRPEIVSSMICQEGIHWRIDFPGAPETCTYASGALIGASVQDSSCGPSTLHDCVPAQLCPERDAGTCVPRSNANRPCDEDVSHFTFCKPTETEQRARLCTPDSGSYFRAASVCDGGVELKEVLTGFGPTHACFYADGALIGASEMSDTNTGPVNGVWALSDCTDVPLCP